MGKGGIDPLLRGDLLCGFWRGSGAGGKEEENKRGAQGIFSRRISSFAQDLFFSIVHPGPTVYPICGKTPAIPRLPAP